MKTIKHNKLTILVFASFFTVLFLIVVCYFVNEYFGLFKQKIKIINPFSSKDSQNMQIASKSGNGYLFIPAQAIKVAATKFSIDIGQKQIGSVAVRLKFKSGPKEIKIGVKGSEKDKFVYQSFYQKLLQECTWDKIEEVGKFLYQKVKKYNNISQLINNPPDYLQIASYYIHPSILMQKLLINNIDQKNQKIIDIKTGLRGSHTFMVRVDNHPFYFKVAKQDINMYAGEDKYLVSISQDGRIIEEKSIPDDGFTGTEKLKKEPQSVEFNLTNIEPGIYEVAVKVENRSDLIITQIVTNQPKMVIKNSVFTFHSEPMTIYTNISPITLAVAHKEFIQTVKLDDIISLDIENPSQKYVFDLENLVPGKKTNEFYKLETPKTDVIFTSSGYFAFSPEQYFDPEVIHATNLNDVTSLDEIDYILTSIPKARQEGEWLVSEVKFDAKDIKIDDKRKLYFSLELPDLAQYGGELEINSFEVEVKVPGIFSSKLGKTESEKMDDGRESTMKSKIGAFAEKIGVFFSGNYQKIKSFFVDSFNSIFHKDKQPAKLDSPTKPPIFTPSPVPTVKTASPTATPKPSPSPTGEGSKSVKISVLNGGAPGGYAQKYADLIKNAGYINVDIGNADNASSSGVLITFPSLYLQDVTTIKNILKTEYTTINSTADDKKTDITIILGSK